MGVLGWFDGGVGFYSRVLYREGPVGFWGMVISCSMVCGK